MDFSDKMCTFGEPLGLIHKVQILALIIFCFFSSPNILIASRILKAPKPSELAVYSGSSNETAT